MMKKLKSFVIGTGYPFFAGGNGQPTLATLHLAHYQRLEAIRKAAKSRDPYLLDLALKDFDLRGVGPE